MGWLKLTNVSARIPFLHTSTSTAELPCGYPLPLWSFECNIYLYLFVERTWQWFARRAAPPCLPKGSFELLELLCAHAATNAGTMRTSDIVFPPSCAISSPESQRRARYGFPRVPQHPLPYSRVGWWGGPLYLSVFTRTAQAGTMRASGMPWPPFVHNSSSGVIVAGPQQLSA